MGGADSEGLLHLSETSIDSRVHHHRKLSCCSHRCHPSCFDPACLRTAMSCSSLEAAFETELILGRAQRLGTFVDSKVPLHRKKIRERPASLLLLSSPFAHPLVSSTSCLRFASIFLFRELASAAHPARTRVLWTVSVIC